MNPQNDVLFSSDLWKPALEKYAAVTHTTVKLYDTNLRTVFGPIHPTPLFDLFDKTGFDPGIFAQCANRCLAQTENRPALVVSQVHGLAVVGTSLVLEGKVVGAAVAGYVLVDFSQVSEIRGIAHQAGVGFERLWQVAREQKPVPQSRLLLNGELLQVLGDALLRENLRTRQLEETGTAKDQAHRDLQQVAFALRENEARFREMIDALPAAVYTTDAVGRLTHYNSAAVELSGRIPQPGTDQWCVSLKMFRPDGTPLPHDECPMAIALKKGRIVRDAEAILERPDGERRWFAAYPTPLRDAEGKIVSGINMLVDITDRKQAEEALRESEEHYRILFELGPVAVYSCDASGVIREFNRRAAELWGRTPMPGDTDERFCGSHKLFRPDGSFMPHEQCPMADVVSGRIMEVRDQEVTIERPDGSRVTVIVNIHALKNQRGEVTGAINCFYDISDRKQAEEALRDSKQRLAHELAATQQLQSASTLLIQGGNGNADALYQKIVDAAVAIMRSDMASMQMLSSKRGHEGELQLLGQSGFAPEAAAFWKWVRPGSGTSCGQALRRLQRVIAADIEECDFMAGTEDLKQYREAGIRAIQSTPLLSRGGRPLGMISTHWRTPHTPTEGDLSLFDILARQAADVIERLQAETARGRLAAIVESSADAIISKDLNSTITTWNRGAEQLFGYTAQEAIGQSITMLIPTDRLDEEPRILDAIRRGERIEHFETVRRHKDGTLLEISLTVSPIIDDNGHIVGASKIARDITVRKQAEAVLKQSHEELEGMVDQRTADLRKLSSNLLRAQDDERRRISRELHDSLGQYLAAAKMSLVGLRRSDATEREAQAFQELTDTLDKCSAETRTLSYLLHPPLLDEVGFASAAKWYVEGFSERSGIEAHLNLPQELERLPRTLELVLFRILQEALTNIHRHTQSRSVDVRLELAGENVVLQVRDHGRGMPPELLGHFRAGKSVGVGLRSMRERISEIGGRLEIQSDTKGTLIRVIAPLSEGATQSKVSAGKASGA